MLNMPDMNAALRSIHQVVVIARFLVLTEADTKVIASILDEAEYLFALILKDDDNEIDEFRRILGRLDHKFPDSFGRLLKEFDVGSGVLKSEGIAS
jgi:hypothetical protein